MSYICPHCGSTTPNAADFCRECGSDSRTGWQPHEEIQYQSVDLPEEEDYEEFLEREGLRPSSNRRRPLWILGVGILLLLSFIMAFIL